MNASQRPPRRRRSALVDEHPAYPTTPAPGPAAEAVHEQPPAAEQDNDTNDGSDHLVSESSRAAARPPGHASVPSRAGEQRARAQARNAAWSWAKARVRLDRRVAEWCDEMAAAREAGTSPAVLREYVREAADRSGLRHDQVPAEVWHAAGLDPADLDG